VAGQFNHCAKTEVCCDGAHPLCGRFVPEWVEHNLASMQPKSAGFILTDNALNCLDHYAVDRTTVSVVKVLTNIANKWLLAIKRRIMSTRLVHIHVTVHSNSMTLTFRI